MAKRKTREEVREELVFLASGIDLYRDWTIKMFYKYNPSGAKLDLDTIIEPGSLFTEGFDAHPGKVSCFLREIKSAYAGVGMELRELLKHNNPTSVEETLKFLRDFKQKMGFDILNDSERLKILAIRVIKKGKITSEDQYYALREIVDDVSQVLLSDDERDQLESIIGNYGGAN